MIASIALLIWLYLYFLHGQFWHSTPELELRRPDVAPDVDIIVPARDEEETIGAVLTSLLAQDYPGALRIYMVDDRSTDETAAIARGFHDERLSIITGAEKPAGWSGKMWAVAQGVEASSAPVLLLTDADIVHQPGHVASLVARLQAPRVDMVSEMVRLNCETLAERALVPAFVYFFQMLYPFALVNNALSRVAAAAGGTIMIRRTALTRIGGIGAIRGALIDDVALARAVKRGGALYLGHSSLATSIRRYPKFADIGRMIARTAFTQLNYAASLLVLTVIGLTLIWLVPPFEIIFGHGWHFLCGLGAFALACLSYMPTLKRYGQGRYWALALPLIALFYMGATISSAFDYWRGRGAQWKKRAYTS
jgi:hopene-associated glycosyltransferase HpnB